MDGLVETSHIANRAHFIFSYFLRYFIIEKVKCVNFLMDPLPLVTAVAGTMTKDQCRNNDS